MRTFKLCLFVILLMGFFAARASCQEPPTIPFQGEVKSSEANVRADSTISSDVLCTLGRGEPLEVVGENFEWYKIRLPKKAPSFVHKSLVAPLDNKTVKVLKENVNIRVGPSELTAIIGRVDKDAALTVIENQGEWFKVEPAPNSYAWIHKKAVLPFRTGMIPQKKEPAPPELKPADQEKGGTPSQVTAEGVVQPYGKVFNRLATHKLIVSETRSFLLRGNAKSLNALNFHKVRITGRVIQTKRKEKYPVLEIEKVELLD